jgi:crotonobetainyl-CoA:carnitine CoA-transferase CaiB-like acyl-CoA transferase
VAEALQSPTVIERGVIQKLEHPELGTIALIRPAHGLAAQSSHQAKAPPMLGEDTRIVLRDVLGFDDMRIDSLALAGVVACRDIGTPPVSRSVEGAVA